MKKKDNAQGEKILFVYISENKEKILRVYV